VKWNLWFSGFSGQQLLLSAAQVVIRFQSGKNNSGPAEMVLPGGIVKGQMAPDFVVGQPLLIGHDQFFGVSQALLPGVVGPV
jgi:hypothetical protein